MDTDRLETFSDGVFAIAITLLVLGIEVPPFSSGLGTELMGLWPSYLAYVVSFLVIGAIWINHHAMFGHVVRADGTLLLLNLLQLMVVAFLPFPTAVLARAATEGIDQPVATAFYGATLFVLGVFVNVMWAYAARGRRLLGAQLTPDAASEIGRRFLIGPSGYGVATVIGLVVPSAALLLFLLLNVFYLCPRRQDKATLGGPADEPANEASGDGTGRA